MNKGEQSRQFSLTTLSATPVDIDWLPIKLTPLSVVPNLTTGLEDEQFARLHLYGSLPAIGHTISLRKGTEYHPSLALEGLSYFTKHGSVKVIESYVTATFHGYCGPSPLSQPSFRMSFLQAPFALDLFQWTDHEPRESKRFLE